MNKEGITDMHLVAGILAYGGVLGEIDSSNVNRQVFIFNSLPKKVFIINGSEVEEVDAGSLEDLEKLFDYRVLMFLPSMPDKVKLVKSLVYRKKLGTHYTPSKYGNK